MSVRVLVADDQEIVRTGLAMILDAQPDIEVVGEAADGREAVALARALRPDVCLFDVRMPEMDGIEATRLLAGPDVDDPMAVVVITTFDLDEYVHGALKAGARGFLLKDAGPQLLVQAIHAAANGDALIAPNVTARLLTAFSGSPPPAQPSEPLTAREEQVLARVAERPHERRDRGRAVHQPEHHEDASREPHEQAAAPATASSSRCGPTRRIASSMRLGIADHFGWAVAVTASGDHEVVDRRRIELVEPGVTPAPIHYESHRLDVDATAALVKTVRASVARASSAALDDIASAMPDPIVSISLRAWPLDFPDDIAVQRRAPYEARADAIMYRQVLSELAHERGWEVHLYDAKAVEAQAAGLLAVRADEVLHGPRATLGSAVGEGPPDRARRDDPGLRLGSSPWTPC